MAAIIISIVRILQQLLCSNQQQQQQAPYPQQQQQQPHAYPPPSPTHSQQAYWPQPAQPQPGQPWQPPQLQHQYEHRPITDVDRSHNPKYASLRARANREGDAMRSCFERSHAAYQAGDGAAAHKLSQEGHAHQQRMEDLDREAADWIFQANNLVSPPGTIDLHGLFVHEAIDRTEQAVQEAQAEGAPSLRLIVGKGLHSQGHVAKIKPAIEDLMEKYRLAAELDPHNAGVLIVHLDAAPGTRGIDADEVSRRLDSGDPSNCVIM